MKDFTDEDGTTWHASVVEDRGIDYKGRFVLTLRADGDEEHDQVSLTDVRWNSRETAARTLDTMSQIELRRRLRSALGRAGRVRRP